MEITKQKLIDILNGIDLLDAGELPKLLKAVGSAVSLYGSTEFIDQVNEYLSIHPCNFG